jgi:hypothetical protein
MSSGELMPPGYQSSPAMVRRFDGRDWLPRLTAARCHARWIAREMEARAS